MYWKVKQGEGKDSSLYLVEDNLLEGAINILNNNAITNITSISKKKYTDVIEKEGEYYEVKVKYFVSDKAKTSLYLIQENSIEEVKKEAEKLDIAEIKGITKIDYIEIYRVEE